MNKIDITKQSKARYKFADRKTLTRDTKFSELLLKKVYEYISDFLYVETPPSSISFLTNNNKRCRVIIYNFKKLLKQKNLFAVIFYGNKRTEISDEDSSVFFNTDWEIAMSMTEKDNILCYASQEFSDGNWFNIVLFAKESAKINVLTKEKHNYASRVLAPKRFSWVRLHNASLPKGISKESILQFKKTKYYNFDTMWFAERVYE